MNIIEKGSELNLSVASKQPDNAPASFYFGAGWDNPNGPVDLDLVAAVLVDGKLTADSNFVYYGNRTAPGVALSEDNQTGEGDGDDESIVINTAELPDNCTGVAIGLVCYSDKADFANAPNPHFRVCDGQKEDSEQMADVQPGSGVQGDTVLVGFTLTKTADGWNLKNEGQFHQKGTGSGAISGFGELYK